MLAFEPFLTTVEPQEPGATAAANEAGEEAEEEEKDAEEEEDVGEAEAEVEDDAEEARAPPGLRALPLLAASRRTKAAEGAGASSVMAL